MSNLAADFIEKVANSSIKDAQKKLPDLIWGKGHLLQYLNWDTEKDVPLEPVACAIGIGELAACNKPKAIEDALTIGDDVFRSRLGKRGASAKITLRTCPLHKKNSSKNCNEKFTVGVFPQGAENIVAHINDNHATSWLDCKKLLHQIAKLERKAVAKTKKHVA